MQNNPITPKRFYSLLLILPLDSDSYFFTSLFSSIYLFAAKAAVCLSAITVSNGFFSVWSGRVPVLLDSRFSVLFSFAEDRFQWFQSHSMVSGQRLLQYVPLSFLVLVLGAGSGYLSTRACTSYLNPRSSYSMDYRLCALVVAFWYFHFRNPTMRCFCTTECVSILYIV